MTTNNIKIAILGFGNVGKAFAKLLIEKQEEIFNKFKVNVDVVAISTRSKGCLVNENGIDLISVLKDLEEFNHFDEKSSDYKNISSIEISENVEYDIVCELTLL